MSMKPIRARGIIVSLDAILAALGFPDNCEIGYIAWEDPFHVKMRIDAPSFDEVKVNDRVPLYRPSFKLEDGKRPVLVDWGIPIPPP